MFGEDGVNGETSVSAIFMNMHQGEIISCYPIVLQGFFCTLIYCKEMILKGGIQAPHVTNMVQPVLRPASHAPGRDRLQGMSKITGKEESKTTAQWDINNLIHL
jgi:hypothetical protein